MKKILSIFALVLCAITLPLGLVGCKKEKQNGAEYAVGKTYTYSSIKMVWESEKEKDNFLTRTQQVKEV